MASPEQIEDPQLRERLEKARQEMRSDPSAAVRTLAEAYVYVLGKRPEMLSETVELRPGLKMPVVMRWPALGANLTLASVRSGKPEVEFVRERFSVSEAITYYEFTLESAIARGL